MKFKHWENTEEIIACTKLGIGTGQKIGIVPRKITGSYAVFDLSFRSLFNLEYSNIVDPSIGIKYAYIAKIPKIPAQETYCKCIVVHLIRDFNHYKNASADAKQIMQKSQMVNTYVLNTCEHCMGQYHWPEYPYRLKWAKEDMEDK